MPSCRQNARRERMERHHYLDKVINGYGEEVDAHWYGGLRISDEEVWNGTESDIDWSEVRRADLEGSSNVFESTGGSDKTLRSLVEEIETSSDDTIVGAEDVSRPSTPDVLREAPRSPTKIVLLPDAPIKSPVKVEVISKKRKAVLQVVTYRDPTYLEAMQGRIEDCTLTAPSKIVH